MSRARLRVRDGARAARRWLKGFPDEISPIAMGPAPRPRRPITLRPGTGDPHVIAGAAGAVGAAALPGASVRNHLGRSGSVWSCVAASMRRVSAASPMCSRVCVLRAHAPVGRRLAIHEPMAPGSTQRGGARPRRGRARRRSAGSRPWLVTLDLTPTMSSSATTAGSADLDWRRVRRRHPLRPRAVRVIPRRHDQPILDVVSHRHRATVLRTYVAPTLPGVPVLSYLPPHR